MQRSQQLAPVSKVACPQENIIVIRHLLRLKRVGKSVDILDIPRHQIFRDEIQRSVFVPRSRNVLFHMKRFVPILHQSEPIFSVKDEIIVHRSRSDRFPVPVNQGALGRRIDGEFAGHASAQATGDRACADPEPFAAKRCQVERESCRHIQPRLDKNPAVARSRVDEPIQLATALSLSSARASRQVQIAEGRFQACSSSLVRSWGVEI